MAKHKKIFLIVLVILLFVPLFWFLLGLPCGQRPRLLRAWILQSFAAPIIEKDIQSDIKQQVINYLELRAKSQAQSKETCFVVFDFYGMSKKRDLIKVYGWEFTLGFKLLDNQVVEGSGESGPIVVLLKRSGEQVKATGYEDSMKSREFIDIFPKSLWHKIFGNIEETDSILRIR